MLPILQVICVCVCNLHEKGNEENNKCWWKWIIFIDKIEQSFAWDSGSHNLNITTSAFGGLPFLKLGMWFGALYGEIWWQEGKHWIPIISHLSTLTLSHFVNKTYLLASLSPPLSLLLHLPNLAFLLGCVDALLALRWS